MIEDLIQDLVDRLDHRHYGKHRGYVHSVEDPEGRARIRAIVPALLGDSTPTGWAEPSLPYAGPDQGLYTIPDLGAGCWIEFEQGDLSKPIWSGCWWGAPTDAERKQSDNATRRATPETESASAAGVRTPETPQHDYPRESPQPKVRILKSATGHHIVLDDRPDSERIEIHDSRGNRLILSREGLDQIVLNERTYNKGARSSDIDGDDLSDIAGSQTENIGGSHDRTVRGNVDIDIKGNLKESAGGGAYIKNFDNTGLSEDVTGARTLNVSGSDTKSVTGAGNHTYGGGLGLSAATGPVNVTSAGPFKVGAAMADTSLDVISISGGLGNVSINTSLGIMQLGGTAAFSPLVLGDGLAIHNTMLSTALKLVNPIMVPVYGPVIDVWAAMTPVLDLSYFAYVKRFPFG